MSNDPNIFDFAGEDLAAFLAKPVSDATYQVVVDEGKTDAPGFEAPASAIPVAGGQLWSNMVDDFVLAAYPLLRQVAQGGGGGGGRFDQTLALGPNSNGQSAYFTAGDTIFFSSIAPPLIDPSVPPSLPGVFQDPNFSGESVRFGVFGEPPGTWTTLGPAPVYTFPVDAVAAGNLIHVRWVGGFKRVDPLNPVPYGMAILEEIWELSFGVWSLRETIYASADAGEFRFQGNGRALEIQCNGSGTSRVARGTVKFTTIDGPQAAP